MQTEHIQQRIETYTADLPQAVQSSNGARFAMLLSLIASNQEAYTPLRRPVTGDGSFELPEAQPLSYPDPNEFYTSEVVGRLNGSVNNRQRGEFAYLVSHVDTQAHIPNQAQSAADNFAQVALMSSGRMMLESIAQSRRSISATA
ncbi:hypothetical protein CLV83_2663 [Marinobacterium mangrovicola]|uniref:Uncharacterized protein n=2 Tax=Marinobacterium mangrovicola TaxID=1476959 RepID=A0A4R1GGE1_9GAMM|nr:hypothetical protein CLV83_2663 [Marinobacterium mangrovicola]